jgi:hypothetical protein
MMRAEYDFSKSRKNPYAKLLKKRGVKMRRKKECFIQRCFCILDGMFEG